MNIVDLSSQEEQILDQAAVLIVEHFDEPHGWPTLAEGREAVAHVLSKGFARGVIDGETLLGWVGGLPEYDGRVWELHPIVVRKEYRRQGIGRKLVTAFESEAASRGAFTFTLGTDDNTGMTSLSKVDLYDDVPSHIAGIRDLGRGHPFLFYRKLGYAITGVMPDANGRGLPDIYMSKAVQRRRRELAE